MQGNNNMQEGLEDCEMNIINDFNVSIVIQYLWYYLKSIKDESY